MRNLLFLFLIFLIGTSCSQNNWKKDSNGVIIYPSQTNKNTALAIRISPLTEEIIQFSVSSANQINTPKNLGILPNGSKISFNVTKQNNCLVISTSKIKVEISTITGEMAFFNKRKELILNEKIKGITSMTVDEADREGTFNFKQVFTTSEKETLFCFKGFHKNRLNEKQNLGIESDTISKAYMPFVISTKNYGFLLLQHSCFAKEGCSNNSRELTILSKEGNQLDYLFIAGDSMEEVNANKNTVTGKTEIVPIAALSLLTDGDYKNSNEKLKKNESKSRIIPFTPLSKRCSHWEDIKQQLFTCINHSMAGYPYSTTLIGDISARPSHEYSLEEWSELNTRVYQLGVFSPLFRVNGELAEKQTPINSDHTHTHCQWSVNSYKRFRNLLQPYIYSASAAVYHNNSIFIRALSMNFYADRRVSNITDQYMFGASLMVCPIYKYKERNRDVYFPNNTGWFDIYTGNFLAGGQRLSVNAPYEHIPVFIREGSIIPVSSRNRDLGEKEATIIDIYVYTGRDAFFTFYEDEGTNYDYKQGNFATIDFEYAEENSTLTINNREGNFPQLIKNRTFRVIKVSRNKPVALLSHSNQTKTIYYKGNKTLIKLQ